MNHSSFSENIHIKSTVRGNLSVNYWLNLKDPHTSTLNVTACSSSGKIIKFDSPFNDPPDCKNARLNHYYYKSLEEFCLKQKRGKGSRTKSLNIKLINKFYRQLYLENINHTEKLKIINRIFKKSIYNFSLHK